MASANLNLIDGICADIRSNLLFVFLAVYSPLTKYGRSCSSAATHSVRGGAGWRKSKTKERRLEKSIIEIKSKMGKNSIIRGMNLEEGATTLIRNTLIGGHNGY